MNRVDLGVAERTPTRPSSRFIYLSIVLRGISRSVLVLLPSVLAWFMCASPAGAEEPLEARCKALDRADFSATRDAPFTTSGSSVVATAGMVPYCRIEGYSIPEISFEVRLPLAGWNHRFVLIGSGGWSNRKFTFLCSEPLTRGYACIAGDGGHQYDDGLWMQSNPQTRIDWGYRATHATAIVGKTLVKAFYGETPSLSLMFGVSTGGYQGLVEAERFPWDFNGIIAIAPDIDEADLSMRTAWAAHHLVTAEGRPVFTNADLQLLHAAALNACDLSDNVRDGVIGNPMACTFDPRTLQCHGSQSSGCLSPTQVDAAVAIYDGPMTSTGMHISTKGPFPGSEMEWPDILEDVRFADDFFRFALTDSPLDGFPASRFNYDEDYKRLGLAGTFISSNPDLRRFKQAGGKLLLVQGGNDATEQAHASIDYYETLQRTMGGPEATLPFARFFLVPGMNHGTGGDGAFAIDYLSAMEGWLTDKAPPDVLIGSHVPVWEKGSAGFLAGLTAPKADMKVTFTRPVYAYPRYAKYRGTGDVNDAGSFTPAEP